MPIPQSSFARAASVISQSRLELEGHTPEMIFRVLGNRLREFHIEISDDEILRIAIDIAGHGPSSQGAPGRQVSAADPKSS